LSKDIKHHQVDRPLSKKELVCGIIDFLTCMQVSVSSESLKEGIAAGGERGEESRKRRAEKEEGEEAEEEREPAKSHADNSTVVDSFFHVIGSVSLLVWMPSVERGFGCCARRMKVVRS